MSAGTPTPERRTNSHVSHGVTPAFSNYTSSYRRRHRHDESELWEHDSDFSELSQGDFSNISDENYDYSLEDIISYIGLGRFQWFVMILAGIVWFSAAIQLMCTSILLLFLKDGTAGATITEYEESIIAAVPFVGEIFGSLLLSMFSDKYGRKKSILIASLLLSFFGTLSAISYDFYMLVVCRLMIGVAVGGSLNCLSLVTEFIPQSHRGEMSYVEVSFWSFGGIYATAIGWLIYYAGLDWRWYLASVSAPSWLCVILIFFIPESPRWLLNNGDFSQLRAQLDVVAEWNDVDLTVLRGQLIESTPVEDQKKGSLRTLFAPIHLRSTLQLLPATFCCTMAYFGVALFQLAYFSEHDRSNFDDIFWEMLVCTSSEIPGTILGIIIFDRVGRIPFLSAMFAVSSVCFLGLVFSPEFVGVALIFLARMCVSTAYNILVVYILEYYPTTIRATALGFMITTARFAGISTSFIAQDLSTSMSSVIFAVCCVVSTGCSVLLPVETLGRELTDASDDGVEAMTANVLEEYDQSTLPLMRHKPLSVIREKIFGKVGVEAAAEKVRGDGVEDEEAEIMRMAVAGRDSPASKSSFF